jgi:ubiquinone/menaquinone biosynthesis C-methylase UbiE
LSNNRTAYSFNWNQKGVGIINCRDIAEKELKQREKKKHKFQDAQIEMLVKLFGQYDYALEVGCGYGFFTKLLASHSKKRVAMDLTNSIAKSVLQKNVLFSMGDACYLPFKSNSFDCVYSVDVIEHIPDDNKFINENTRVLKSGGTLIIGTPNKDRIYYRLRKFIGKPFKYPLIVGSDPILGDAVHVREYNRAELIDIIEKHNFQIEHIIGVYLGVLGKYSFGLKHYPKILEDWTQFWFVKAKKL